VGESKVDVLDNTLVQGQVLSARSSNCLQRVEARAVALYRSVGDREVAVSDGVDCNNAVGKFCEREAKLRNQS